MVKILDNMMIKVMMAVLTLSWAFDASASGSRSYFEYNGLCYKISDIFLSSSYAIVTYPDDKSDFNQDFYAVGDITIPSTILYDGWTIPGETGACWDSMGGIKQCRNLHFRAGRQD